MKEKFNNSLLEIYNRYQGHTFKLDTDWFNIYRYLVKVKLIPRDLEREKEYYKEYGMPWWERFLTWIGFEYLSDKELNDILEGRL